MIKSCENCKKQSTCHATIGYMFGFCETDFEPIERIERYRGYDIEYNVYGQKELFCNMHRSNPSLMHKYQALFAS